jgi:hypothetical protein
VAADQGPGTAPQPLGHFAELESHLLTGKEACLGGLRQRYTRAYEKRFHAGDCGLHRFRDLLVRHRIHLSQHQCRPLGLREIADVPDQQPELLPVVHLVGGAGAVVRIVDVHRVDTHRLVPPQVVQAPVAGDPVEPRPDLDRPLVGEDRVERSRHDLLEDVLSVLSRSQ